MTDLPVSDEDSQRLGALARAGGRNAKRAHMVMLLSSGKSPRAVADEVGLSNHTVYKWRRRFASAGVAGLRDLARSGQPRRLDAARRAEIARITRDELPPLEPRWTLRSLASMLGVTQHQVRTVWRESALREPARLEHGALGGLLGLFIAPPVCALVTLDPLGNAPTGTPALRRPSLAASPLRAVHRQASLAATPTALVETGVNFLSFLAAAQDRTGAETQLGLWFSSPSAFAVPGLARLAFEARGFHVGTEARVDAWVDGVEAYLRDHEERPDNAELGMLSAAIVRYLAGGATCSPFAWLRGRPRVIDLRRLSPGPVRRTNDAVDSERLRSLGQ